MGSFWDRLVRRTGWGAALRTARTGQQQAEIGRGEAFAGRRQAESDLKASEAQFSQLVAGVRDYAVFLLDPSGNVATWNSGAELIKGYRPEEIIGQHFSRFYPVDSVTAGWPDHELEVASQVGRFEDEGWRLRKDGSRFWASVVITAIRDSSGGVQGFLKITRDLTDRRQAAEKLRISEERFRLLVEGIKDYAVFMLDPEGRVATWNMGAQRLKGYSAEEIVGRHFSCFYPQDVIDRGWPEEELRRAIVEGRIEDEGWRLRKDGSRFWASVVITALRDESGTLRGFAKITRDLTLRREAEENARRLAAEEAARSAAEESAAEIERQRQQLYVTLQSIGDAVVVTDEQGRVTFLNPVAADLTGWSTEEAAGQPLNEVFRILNEVTRQPVENPVDTVFREQRIVELANHTVVLHRDGREIPIEDSAAPIRVSDGGIVGAVLVFRDVTAARRASEARQYLAAIVESSEDAIIGLTLDGEIASWNRGAERLYGYTADETIGQRLDRLVPPDHPDELPMILERMRQGEFIDHFETIRVRKDGTRVEVSLTISPVRNKYGEIIGISKIARDISVRKEEERRKSEFLALLAHELRNPLAPILSGLQVMQLAHDEPETMEEVRDVMERQVEHLVRLVDDLLDVSRIGQGKLELRKERITVQAVIEHALEMCSGTVGKGLSVSVPSESILINGDKTRLCQTVCNLVNNAVKYSDRGSPITLSVERNGPEVSISVRDQGVGIPADQLARVFDMFVQVDHSLEKSQGGLGVGLAIVKRLVEMHGGTVEAHSEGAGRGSEFIVRLPVAVEERPAPQQGNGSSGETKPPQRKILVVDDNIDAANALARLLKLMGNEVHTAADGVAGLEAAESLQPDLVLLDIGMPRMNGFDVARRIRESEWGKLLPLAALTGWGLEEDRRKSREAGFDFHLVKPIDRAALEKLLTDLAQSRG